MSIIQLIKEVMNEKMTLKKRPARTFINPFIVRIPSSIKEIPSKMIVKRFSENGPMVHVL